MTKRKRICNVCGLKPECGFQIIIQSYGESASRTLRAAVVRFCTQCLYHDSAQAMKEVEASMVVAAMELGIRPPKPSGE
jgi:hypothetical protein